MRSIHVRIDQRTRNQDLYSLTSNTLKTVKYFNGELALKPGYGFAWYS